MAQEHVHEHESHAGLIWKVFGVLTLVTIVEVVLGIIRPDVLYLHNFMSTSWLNWIFIILTIVKAYGITWYFMHMKDEKAGLRRAIVWTGIFLICYLTALLLIEGGYLSRMLIEYTRW
ncbi:MAG: cytochrome C oxidase subunit IV [Flavobacteriales bacterium]|nr:MAG: cytochrome C oxidase subunit IV [Flavobacteriales bacterium]